MSDTFERGLVRSRGRDRLRDLIENILKSGLDSQPFEPANVVPLPMHPNARGADYFQPELPNPDPEGDTAC